MIELFVKGTPVAQPRHRARCVNGKPQIYTPESVTAWKETIILEFRKKYQGFQTVEGPVSVAVMAYLPRPKRKIINSEIHAVKPDSDNLLKPVMDSLTTAGVWGDDSQVADIFLSKRYERENASPGVYIIVKALSV